MVPKPEFTKRSLNPYLEMQALQALGAHPGLVRLHTVHDGAEVLTRSGA